MKRLYLADGCDCDDPSCTDCPKADLARRPGYVVVWDPEVPTRGEFICTHNEWDDLVRIAQQSKCNCTHGSKGLAFVKEGDLVRLVDLNNPLRGSFIMTSTEAQWFKKTMELTPS